MKYPDARLLLFAREPVQGQVKSRLVPVLGEAGALDLYLQLLQRQMAMLADAGLCPLQLWVAGDVEHEAFRDFPGEKRRQQGGDLGERLAAAFHEVLQDCRAVLVIGCDCPALDRAYLDEALRALEEGADLVLGPASDGGYVLIGLAREAPELFQGVDWGSERVLAQTLAAAERGGLQVRLLAELSDIDRPEDLAQLADFGIFPTISRRLLAGDREPE